ncbi:ABC transporter ATP-binding protein [Ramlibacter sp. 2FC]|uniref:ABC transporter ATP-binding protein n=1 Tax=Ramlibacter sp. 2FC TaxID=2502188 RepID=UPI0010F45E3A|nr:ABC transporter ATP-binding protein [Ramlibacter sp. 2FC]
MPTSPITSSAQGGYLDIRGLGKRFGSHEALADVSLSIRRGEFVCLLGPSGCGKTTLLRIIAGFEKADRGHLLLEGRDIVALAPHQRGFGMVFQSLALFPHMSVADNIAYGMKLRGVAAAQRRRRVEELLELVQLPAVADRPVSALSGGQRQRVAIARALAVPPPLFLLDEPLSALDAQLRDNMQIELRQLQQRFGVTTVVVTHDQHEAMMLADRLVVMKQGRVQQCDRPTEVYRRPANAFVAEFLGAANLLPGTAQADGSLHVLGAALPADTRLAAGSAVTLAVRAEDVGLQALADSAEPAGQLVGDIEFVRDLGPQTELIVRCGAERLRCRSAHTELRRLGVGQQVAVRIDARRCAVFPAQS